MTRKNRKQDEKYGFQAVDAETRVKLALAVAKPGSDALLIDEANQPVGHRPIAEAARSGKCFAVELCDDMVGLDVDKGEAARWVRNFLMGELESRKIPIVVQNSG